MAQNAAVNAVEEQTPQKKKLPLLKIIILVVILAALGGGGFFGWKKFMKADTEHAKKPDVQEKVTQDMGTFLVNLADAGGKRYLKISMQFELNNQKVGIELGRRTVEVRDLILMLLSSKEYEEIGNPNGKKTLKNELISKLNRALQDGQVKEIYFTDFLVQ